jgi:hypothetical protein
MYDQARTHFAADHAQKLKDGYAAVNLPLPDYAKLSRKDALAAIKTFETAAAGKSGAAADALKLLKGFEKLSPDVVLESWVLEH